MDPGINPKEKPTIVLAGATGFVGGALARELVSDFHIIGLSRSDPATLSAQHPHIEWRQCDFFSLLELERAFSGARYGVYLVHSMLPSSRLNQALFEDLDLLLADNFARAAEKNKLEQIVYIGGLIPNSGKLSRHLKSRLEVERTLASRTTPLTSLRCGLIIGVGGSSLEMLVNLVRRVPIMILPKWTASRTQPIAIEDVLFAVKAVTGNRQYYGQTFDIGIPEVLTYRTMLKETAEVLGVRRLMFSVPVFSRRLSLAWVALFGSAPIELVGPLIESLRHEMLVRNNPLQELISARAKSFRATLSECLDRYSRTPTTFWQQLRARRERLALLRKRSFVRSVQRLPLPPEKNAEWVADEYARWLPRLLRPVIRCEIDGHRAMKFYLPGAVMLLELTFAPERSAAERQVFYISGGLLADTTRGNRARFELREVNGHEEILAAIHDYAPTLPWYLYIVTQALIHLWVMRRFRKHLGAKNLLVEKGERSRKTSRLPRSSIH